MEFAKHNMKTFLVLFFCVIVLVSARPDVSLGYHYNPDYNSGSNVLAPPPPLPPTSYFPTASGPDAPISSFGSANFLAPDYNVAAISSASASSSASSGSSSFSNAASSAGVGYNSGNSGYNTGGSIDQGGASGYDGQSYTGGISQGYIGSAIGGSNQQYAQQYQEQTPIITKHFYVHSAPEDHDNQEIVRYITIGRPTTNYRVVFINAPSSTSTKAKIIAKVAPVQERTAIYLLTKKQNDLDISADVVTPAPTPANKPDVFFIKYNTPEEAIHAQHVIQAQYDKLGGSSDFSNQGNVPVQSVIGSVGGQSNAASSSQASASAQSSSQSTGYSTGQNQIQQIGNVQPQPQPQFQPKPKPQYQPQPQPQYQPQPQPQPLPQPQANYLPPTVYRRRRYYRY